MKTIHFNYGAIKSQRKINSDVPFVILDARVVSLSAIQTPAHSQMSPSFAFSDMNCSQKTVHIKSPKKFALIFYSVDQWSSIGGSWATSVLGAVFRLQIFQVKFPSKLLEADLSRFQILRAKFYVQAKQLLCF